MKRLLFGAAITMIVVSLALGDDGPFIGDGSCNGCPSRRPLGSSDPPPVAGSANFPEDRLRGCHLLKERLATWQRYFAAAKVGPLPGARRITTFLAPPAIQKKHRRSGDQDVG